MDTEGCSASAAAASAETVEQPKSTTPAKAAFSAAKRGLDYDSSESDLNLCAMSGCLI